MSEAPSATTADEEPGYVEWVEPDPADDPWPPYSGEPPPPGPDGPIPSDELCAWVRERSDAVLLGMSFGKDSLAAFRQLTRFWRRDQIVGYNLYLAPHLGFQQRSRAYYERELGIPIYAMPNRSLYLILRTGTMQPPSHLPVLLGTDLPDMPYEAIYSTIADSAGLDLATTWVATGVRAADSPMRRIAITQRGPVNLTARTFYPVWDHRKTQVLAALDDLGVALPVDYRLWGRTFDGLDHRFIAPLAEHFPEDYRRLLELYPLIGAEFARRGEPIPMDRE